MFKIKYHKLKLQPCDAEMRVYFNREALKSMCKKEGAWSALASAESCQGLFIGWSKFYYIMYLPEEYDDVVVYHEALHATTKLWEDAGAELDSCKNDEVLTYTQGYIVAEIKKLYKLHEDIK